MNGRIEGETSPNKFGAYRAKQIWRLQKSPLPSFRERALLTYGV